MLLTVRGRLTGVGGNGPCESVDRAACTTRVAIDCATDRRTKQDLGHLLKQQKEERAGLRILADGDIAPGEELLESPSNWVLPRGWVEHSLAPSARVPDGGKRQVLCLKLLMGGVFERCS